MNFLNYEDSKINQYNNSILERRDHICVFRNKNKQKGSHLKKRCSFNLYLDSNENRNDEVLSESTNDDYKSFDVDSKNSDNGVKRIMTDDINSNDKRKEYRQMSIILYSYLNFFCNIFFFYFFYIKFILNKIFLGNNKKKNFVDNNFISVISYDQFKKKKKKFLDFQGFIDNLSEKCIFYLLYYFKYR